MIIETLREADGFVLPAFFKNSYVYSLNENVRQKIKVSFRQSFLAKAIGMLRNIDMAPALKNSKFFDWPLGFCKKLNYRIIGCLETSAFKETLEELKKDLYFAPLKRIGIILIIAVLVNVFFYLLLKNQIKLIDLIIWGLLLFTGISSQFYNVSWQTIKKSSLILKLLLKNNVRDLRKDKF